MTYRAVPVPQRHAQRAGDAVDLLGPHNVVLRVAAGDCPRATLVISLPKIRATLLVRARKVGVDGQRLADAADRLRLPQLLAIRLSDQRGGILPIS